MPSFKLHLPFQGQWRVYTGGDTAALNNHHGIAAQNYAFDFDKIDKTGNAYSGKGTVNTNWYAFGEPAIAPADGEVIEVVDGVLDNLPRQTANTYAHAGNHVIIRHSGNAFSFIAHLKQGSIRVKPGDKLKTGEQLGECGNSGYSLMPHLHYHLQDSLTVAEWHGIEPKAKARGKKVSFSNVILTVDGQKQHKQSYSPVKLDLVESNT